MGGSDHTLFMYASGKSALIHAGVKSITFLHN